MIYDNRKKTYVVITREKETARATESEQKRKTCREREKKTSDEYSSEIVNLHNINMNLPLIFGDITERASGQRREDVYGNVVCALSPSFKNRKRIIIELSGFLMQFEWLLIFVCLFFSIPISVYSPRTQSGMVNILRRFPLSTDFLFRASNLKGKTIFAGGCWWHTHTHKTCIYLLFAVATCAALMRSLCVKDISRS